MSYKFLLATVATTVGILSCSQLSFARDQKRTFEKSVFNNFKALPVNRSAADKTVKNVHANFAGWAVTTDKLNGCFTDIYGTPITIDGTTDADKAQNCMVQKLKTCGVNKAEWQQVSNFSAPKADYVNYKEVIYAHSVVFATLSFRFTKTGDLARIQMKNYGSPSKNVKPAISAQAAKDAATKDLDGVAIKSAMIDDNWEWFPIPSAKGYELHPAWHFKITGNVPGSVPLSLTGYIDALTGDLLYRTNEVKETAYDLTVKGVVYKNGTLNPATLEPLQDLDLHIGSTNYYTDNGGLFSSTALSLPLSTAIPLKGKWSKVIDSVTGLMPSFTDLVSLAGTTYTYPTTAPCSDRHINAYYHVDRVHNFMKGYFPTFTGLDFALPTNVDLGSGNCNAFYSGHDINFYAADATCHSFAEIGDIIYHEYGHAISDHLYTSFSGSGINNGALNEAMSDVWAMSITHNPVLGQNGYVGFGGFIRRYDQTPQVYPIDLQGFDIHKDGQIIAGTWWDVGVNIGSADTMTRLFTDVYYDTPDGPDGSEGSIYQSILVSALMADDDNANLFDGTPHYAQIIAAFAKHGIYLEGDVNLLYTELQNQPAATAIPVSAVLSMTSSAHFHDLTLYYRINGTGAWTSEVLTASGADFSGTIPAQPAGTVVDYYFVLHDNLNTPGAFFPITCNPALPVTQTTIDYQFGVGIQTGDSTTFETNPASAGWHIGSNTGDNAVSGKWHWGLPIPNSLLTSWPQGDNTTGSGHCLITGFGNTGTFGAGVKSGATSVLSPVFDISTFVDPVISYYRWFSNEQDLENFKKDPWTVKIKDASGSTWQNVENTYQADVNWRHRIFRVSTFLPTGTSQIQLKFFASDSVFSTWSDNGQTACSVGGLDDFFIYNKAVITGVNNIAAAKANIFPNPADGEIQIVLQAANTGSISLYDITGRKVTGVAMEKNNLNYSLNTKTLAAGSYNLVIQTGESIQSKQVAIVHQ